MGLPMRTQGTCCPQCRGLRLPRAEATDTDSGLHQPSGEEPEDRELPCASLQCCVQAPNTQQFRDPLASQGLYAPEQEPPNRDLLCPAGRGFQAMWSGLFLGLFSFLKLCVLTLILRLMCFFKIVSYDVRLPALPL